MMKTHELEEQINLMKSEIFYIEGALNNLEGMVSCANARNEEENAYLYVRMLKDRLKERIKVLQAEIAKIDHENSSWTL
jgi:uncharacterized small protein (DUF1192 family)